MIVGWKLREKSEVRERARAAERAERQRELEKLPREDVRRAVVAAGDTRVHCTFGLLR